MEIIGERSKRDTFKGITIENWGRLLFYIYMLDVCMSFCTFTLVFLRFLGGRSHPHTPLNRIL